MKINDIPFQHEVEEVVDPNEYYRIRIEGFFKDGTHHQFMYLSGAEILKLKELLETHPLPAKVVDV